MDLSKVMFLIDGWNTVNENRYSSLASMLSNKALGSIIREHEDAVKKFGQDNSFTVFELISDLYYRENFHSDVIAFFLDPRGNHGYGSLGLDLFIKLISDLTKRHISPSWYSNAEVYREQGRIDVLVKDESSRHAFIIENKMNNAGDMPRQIPRYCEFLSAQGLTIDAAVYLPLLRFKRPDTSSWNEEDKKWWPLVSILPAVTDDGSDSLSASWLGNLASLTKQQDVASTIRQYTILLSKLSKQNMDKVSFDKFYDYLLKDDNLDTANSIASMMDELPQYLYERIYDSYSTHCYPFEKVWPYQERGKKDAVFEKVMIGGVYFKMDIWLSTRNYDVFFWAPEDKDVTSLQDYSDLKPYLASKGIHIFDSFRVDGKYRLSTTIPISTPLNEFIDPILKELAEHCDQ